MVTIQDLIDLIRIYNPDEEQIILKAYNFAKALHQNQKRASGEDYISHPVNVAYILALMAADRDTICAALLHDVLEDTRTTKEEIALNFNQTIADLVDGVTKTYHISFFSKSSQNIANQRKIITSMTEDVRIIIIKLADRLHNMRTLEFKDELKQKEKAVETLEIFTPLAKNIGAYILKNELEDLSLKYLKPDIYERINDQITSEKQLITPSLEEMLLNINNLLSNDNISHEIKIMTKHIYEIYKKLNQNNKLTDIHDLHVLKIVVDDIRNCYQAFGLVHSQYHPVHEKFKDYISNPKANMYQAIHTTVFGPGKRLVQAKIKTFDMDKIADFGLTAYWDINKGLAREKMQAALNEKFRFYRSLNEMNMLCEDDLFFVNQVKKELFAQNVFVYTSRGDIIELPVNSTVIDFAYSIHSQLGDTMIGATVNGCPVAFNYQLKNNDRIVILNDKEMIIDRSNWEEQATTTHAKRKIKEYKNRLG